MPSSRSPPICNQGYLGIKLHKVAGKCGVFAETDINGLQKEGTPSDELMASLFDAIVLQNLTVLTRGHTLRPHVLLLGGPNTFIRGMREAWQHNIPKMWAERGVEIPDGESPATLIKTPDNAQYFAALGAIEFGKDEEAAVGRYLGANGLAHYINVGRLEEKAAAGGRGLSASADELEAFRLSYCQSASCPRPSPPARRCGRLSGSTADRRRPGGAPLRGRRRAVEGLPALEKAADPGHHRHLRGAAHERRVRGRGARVLGVGTTGYAKDVLKDVLAADAALVETVAHTESAVK